MTTLPLTGRAQPAEPSDAPSHAPTHAPAHARSQAPSDGPGGETGPVPRRIRVPVPPGFPSGTRCDVVETSARDGLRILGRLPGAGCVLARGDRWSWIVPTGSDVDVGWPPVARYLVDAAVLVPSHDAGRGGGGDGGGGEPGGGGHEVVHVSGHRAPYTHPILLYFATCCVAGTTPAMTVT